MPVHEDVLKERQSWFWRRITLQTTLFSLLAMLGYITIKTALLKQDWTGVSIVCALLVAIVWLVTIYFAAVNDAAKISSVVGSLGKAIGDARENDKKDE